MVELWYGTLLSRPIEHIIFDTLQIPSGSSQICSRRSALNCRPLAMYLAGTRDLCTPALVVPIVTAPIVARQTLQSKHTVIIQRYGKLNK